MISGYALFGLQIWLFIDSLLRIPVSLNGKQYEYPAQHASVWNACF